ncbi:uncharacterized protein LOC124646022 [Helicoverpa zea]|uniref:uncharacterized protein LOC124646022 n=1 Tax=Helicoverpa zea TaxID=7113 RepID=UPI001F5789B5|nr:uncharacterized protein LOC124646022 [Helicoverpa zea]XP_047041993.1 uncharacterized protein LOC124646022 [Helicoverpa zea]XP_047041994.1 uncharacterized protein LOC124646022 [Helicoverpa zea]
MESSKRHATAAQVTALMDFMQEHSDVAKGLLNSGLEREDLEAQWQDLTATLNSMGGAVKSVDKWKQTWRDLKSNTKKRALKQQSLCDTSGGLSSEGSGDASQSIDNENYVPPQKRCASFDEEIIKIERDKLEFEREYKIQKIEVLSRIAAALEDLAKKQ